MSFFSIFVTGQLGPLQKNEFLAHRKISIKPQSSWIMDSDDTCDHPSKWKKGKKLRIDDKFVASFLPLPPTVDDVEYYECAASELDFRAHDELEMLSFRRHIGPVRVYFPPNLRRLVIHHSQLVFMTPLPDSLITLIIRESSTSYEISHLPNLETFVWDYNTCPELPTLPLNLQYLHCIDSLIDRLPDPLPPRLKLLICRNCRLTSLPPLPPTLEWLRCHEMEISRLPQLPAGLLGLDFQDCALTALPPLPKQLEELDVRNNRIAHIPEIPASVEYVNICGNPIETYPYIYRTNLWIMFDYNHYAAALNHPKLHIDRMIAYSPRHLLEDLDVAVEDDPFMDIYEDEGFQATLLRRLQVMCEIQKQVACRAALKIFKEELMMRTWHPSRVEAWCGVDFGAMDD